MTPAFCRCRDVATVHFLFRGVKCVRPNLKKLVTHEFNLGATWEQNPRILAGVGFPKSPKSNAGYSLEIGLNHSVTHEVAGSIPVVPASVFNHLPVKDSY
jgi:hypothetical protein